MVYQELDVQVLGAFDAGIQMVQSCVEIGNWRRATTTSPLHLLAVIISLIATSCFHSARARTRSPITIVAGILIIMQTAVTVNILVRVRVIFILVIAI